MNECVFIDAVRTPNSRAHKDKGWLRNKRPDELMTTVYGGLCMPCHDAGVAGAPIKGSEQMGERLATKGLDMLVQNAINGINAMPARGGNPSLTDEQIRVAVEFMLP